MNLLIMGGPGAGKGTMSEKILEKYNISDELVSRFVFFACLILEENSNMEDKAQDIQTENTHTHRQQIYKQ